MAKVSALPELAPGAIDGTETVPVVKAGGTYRSPTAAIMAPHIAEATAWARELSYFPNLYDPAADRIGWVLNTGGAITEVAGWVTSGFIPVEPGKTYTISANAIFRQLVRFSLTASDVDPAVQMVGNNVYGYGPLVVTAPEGVAYMVFTVATPTVPRPDFFMINQGEGSKPYRPHRLEIRDDAVPLDLKTFKEALERDVVVLDRGANLYNPATDRPGFFLSNNGNVLPTADWTASGFIPIEEGKSYTISSSGPRRAMVGFFSDSVDQGFSLGTYDGPGGNVSTPLTFTAPEGARFLVFNVETSTVPQPDWFMLNEGVTALPYVPWTEGFYRVRADAVGGSPGTPTGPLLVLAGEGESYVESQQSGSTIRNTFVAFPGYNLTAHPCRFNIRAISVNGVQIRTALDDVAPDHALGTTIDANHGYALGRCTTDAPHGKTAASEGQIVTTGGVESVLVKVEDGTTLLLAVRNSNVLPAVGDYIYASGPGETGGFSVSAVVFAQWYPPHNGKSVRTFVDGKPLSAIEGPFPYSHHALITETVNVLDRQTIIDWWIANGGASGGDVPAGDPAYVSSISYRFDQDGQLVIPRDWTFVAPTPVVDLMGLQVQRTGAPLEYVVPSAVPFDYDGETLDYAMGVASDRTQIADGTPTINFGATNLQGAGEYGHRAISVWDDVVLAVGMLPIGDAAYDLRRVRVSNIALSISGASAKLYFRLLDQGAFTAAAGERYSMVGYRIVAPRDAEGNWSYVVRAPDGTAWLYADWRNTAGLRRILPPADLIGRSFAVHDSKNAEVAAGMIAGDISINVDAGAAAAYLVLKIT